MAPPGLTALGAKGSVRDRLTPPGRVEGSALGSYIAPLRWRGGRPFGRHFLCRLWRLKPYNRPDGRGNAFPLWWLAPPPSRPAGKRVTGFSVAYSFLRIQFPCHHFVVGLWVLSNGAMSLQESIEIYSAPCIGGGLAQPDRGRRAQRANQQNGYFAP